MNIEVIFNYNTELSKKLAERTSGEIQSDDIKIGDIFVYMVAIEQMSCNFISCHFSKRILTTCAITELQ